MIIHWKPNPFHTTVELDEHDKKMYLKSYKAEQYENIVFDMSYDQEYHPERFNTETVSEKFKQFDKICDLDLDSKEFKQLMRDLDDMHFGDCTCVACSCMRCRAEDLLEINTINCGKHIAYKIQGAFHDNCSIDIAIERLKDMTVYDKKPDPDNFPGGYDMWVPRWKAERTLAAEWLIDYKKDHNF